MSLNAQANKKNGRGFTLVELLIVTVLFSFLGLVLYTAFYQGASLWKRAQMDRGEFRDLFLAEKMLSDLRNMIPMAGRETSGSEKKFEFYTLLPGRELGQKGKAAEILFPCRVRYSLNERSGQVVREVQSYTQILMSSTEARQHGVLLEHVRDFNMLYYGRPESFSLHWQKHWEKECLPNAVKISVQYDGQNQVFSRILDIPGGGCRILNPKAT